MVVNVLLNQHQNDTYNSKKIKTKNEKSLIRTSTITAKTTVTTTNYQFTSRKQYCTRIEKKYIVQFDKYHREKDFKKYFSYRISHSPWIYFYSVYSTYLYFFFLSFLPFLPSFLVIYFLEADFIFGNQPNEWTMPDFCT